MPILAATRVAVYEILAVNADGTNQRLLVGQDYVQNIQPANRTVSFDFAPASHTLYFVTDQYDLHRVNADSGSPMPCFRRGQRRACQLFARWPLDDALSSARDWSWPVPMVQRHGSSMSGARMMASAHMGPEIIWAPDSAGFRMVTPTGPQGGPDSMTVWYFPVNGDPVKQMSYTGPYGANLSPDGRTVVYLYYQREPIEVHVVSADGKDTIFGSYASPSDVNLGFMGWAPDSKHFLLNLSKDGRLQVPYLCAVGEQPVETHRYRRCSPRRLD